MVEVEFGEPMIKQIEAISGKPDGSLKDPLLKFDDKGSVHLMYHDDEGELKHDTKIVTTENTPSYKQELEQEVRLAQDSIVKQSKRLNKIFDIFVALLIIMTILSICIVTSLR